MVDEGLLALSPNRSWDLLRRHDGAARLRACAPRPRSSRWSASGTTARRRCRAGGGGGRQPTRELFDTLLLWAPRVALDERGEARVEVPLNDSLTSFRVEAVATAGLGQFGSGGTALRTTQDLMLLPGLPPLVREGDRFRADFTRPQHDGARHDRRGARHRRRPAGAAARRRRCDLERRRSRR